MSPAKVFITGAHGLTLVCSKYNKGFLLNNIGCLLENKKFPWILAMDNIPKVTTKKRKKRKFPLTFSLSVKVIIQVWKSQRVF